MIAMEMSGEYSQGPGTLSVNTDLHAENRERLLKAFGASVTPNSYILLQGGQNKNDYDTDTEPVFRQEAYFFWTFGVLESGWYGAIDVQSKLAILFMPRLPQSYGLWMGPIYGPDHFKAKYQVDEIHYVDELDSYFTSKGAALFYTLYGKNTDSGLFATPASFPGMEKFKEDKERLFPAITGTRVYKTSREMEILRYVVQKTCEAHKQVMISARPGTMEYQAEAVFQHHNYFHGGCRFCAYTCICAAGWRGSVLHYGAENEPNQHVIKHGDMCLFDMGAVYYGYCADVTVSFPANGVFTEPQKMVYNAVLRANRAVLTAVKPGAKWVDMHALAERTMLEDMIAGGLILPGSIDEMIQLRLPAYFFPHGLGHFLGLCVHDVGGYLDGVNRPSEMGFSSLRTARVLEAGMVVTIEPGWYFIDYLLDQLLADPNLSRFINQDMLKSFRGFGGVRIEDDVWITSEGSELISSNLPRTVEEIEAFMSKSRAGFE